MPLNDDDDEYKLTCDYDDFTTTKEHIEKTDAFDSQLNEIKKLFNVRRFENKHRYDPLHEQVQMVEDKVTDPHLFESVRKMYENIFIETIEYEETNNRKRRAISEHPSATPTKLASRATEFSLQDSLISVHVAVKNLKKLRSDLDTNKVRLEPPKKHPNTLRIVSGDDTISQQTLITDIYVLIFNNAYNYVKNSFKTSEYLLGYYAYVCKLFLIFRCAQLPVGIEDKIIIKRIAIYPGMI